MTDDKYGADGCLLVAPSYPGSSREDDAAAAKRADQQRISCWTVEQLARFVELAEQKKLTATDILTIVLNHYSPGSVTEAVNELLREREFDGTELYRGIISSLRDLENKMPHHTVRTVDNIHTALAMAAFNGISRPKVKEAVEDLARLSQGALILRDDRLIISTSLEEIERRVVSLTRNPGQPRRPSRFRSD